MYTIYISIYYIWWDIYIYNIWWDIRMIEGGEKGFYNRDSQALFLNRTLQ